MSPEFGKMKGQELDDSLNLNNSSMHHIKVKFCLANHLSETSLDGFDQSLEEAPLWSLFEIIIMSIQPQCVKSLTSLWLKMVLISFSPTLNITNMLFLVVLSYRIEVVGMSGTGSR